MAGKKEYTVLHDFTIRVDEDTGEERRFASGDDYDGPAERLEELLAGVDFHGPLIAEKTSAAPPSSAEKES